MLDGIPQDGTTLGRANAPVTLLEYADLQCPYCAQWAIRALPALVEDYVRAGKLRIEFRGLAFVGPDSDTALRTALAAGRQDRLWHVVELLYANQGAENSGWVTDDLIATLTASVPGLHPEQVAADRQSAAVDAEIAKAQAHARAANVRGTPAFEIGRTGRALAVAGGHFARSRPVPRRGRGGPRRMTDGRLVKATAALALIGVGITAYLTFAHYADGSIVCPTDGCETVQRSSYALLGSVPVALLGLGAYLVILGGLFLPRDYSRPAVLATALAGFAFSTYLLAVQAVDIGAFCTWCLASDAVVTVIAALSAMALWTWQAEPGGNGRYGP